MNNATGNTPFLFINCLQIKFQKGIDKTIKVCYNEYNERGKPRL